MSIGLVVGEDADIPLSFIKKHGIEVYSFSINLENWNVKQNIYEFMRKNAEHNIKTLPKTSQPSIGQFQQVFTKALSKHEHIIVFTISSKVSGCYNSALQARELMKKDKDRVHIIDTQCSSGGAALLIISCIEIVDRTNDWQKIQEHIEQQIPQIKLIGMMENPMWLEAGGRISPPVAMVMKQMQKIGVRPIIGLKEGKIGLMNVKMNAQYRPEAMLAYIKQDLQTKQFEKLTAVITHADLKKEAEDLKKLLLKSYPNAIVPFINETTPVLGAHIGPGALIISWIVE